MANSYCSQWLPVFASAFLGANIAAAQVFAVPVEAASQDADSQGNGFQFETNAKLQDHLTDFRRHADRGLFEKAIEVLDRLDAEQADGLLESDNGLLLPSSEQIFRLQADMGGELRDAFRLFLDPKAKKEFESATVDGSRESLVALNRVRQRYFVSSVGDEATNLLGDAAFREGDFRRAARHYQDVLDYHPDSDLDVHWLLFKRGLANFHGGDPKAAGRALRTLRERHEGRTVRFAGREVDAAGELANIIQSPPEPDIETRGPERGLGSLPETLQIVWRHQYLTDASLTTLQQSEQSYYYKGAVHFLPPVAVSGDRLAFNYYGAVSAVDLNTGKLAWSDTKPADTIGKMSQNFYGMTTDAYGLAAGGEGESAAFVSRAIPPDRFNYWRVGAEVTAHAADDGRQRWTTGSSNRGQSEWYHIGTPYVQGAVEGGKLRTYVMAVKSQGGSEAFLRVMDNSKANDIRLGRYRGVNLDNYQGRSVPNPIIVPNPADEDSLLIFLDEGLLLSFSKSGESVVWGLRLPVPGAVMNTSGYNQGQTVANTLHPKSSLRIDKGIAFIKDGERASVSAVDVGDRSVVWQRRISPLSEVVGLDADRVYVLGKELTALNREDGSLVWSVPLPMGNGGLSCVVLQDTVAVFTDRGLYELGRSDGSLVRIHREVEPESGGGRVMRLGNRLVTVSEKAITAYAMAGPEDEKGQVE